MNQATISIQAILYSISSIYYFKKGDACMEDLDLIKNTALTFVKELTSDIGTLSANEGISIGNIQLSQSALKWILHSKDSIDIPENQLDEVLDKAAILLSIVYRDKESLPKIADLIFKRHRKGCFNHDLIWAFFEAKDISSLHLIANRLLSSNQEDVLLARKLLSFIPEINNNTALNNKQLYKCFVNWFEENSLFLHYTGESYNMTSTPIPYEVILKAKYLCKPVSVETGQIIQKITNREYMLLQEFDKLDHYTQSLLAWFSYKIHHMNRNWWNIWLTYPISHQIMYANAAIGGIQ